MIFRKRKKKKEAGEGAFERTLREIKAIDDWGDRNKIEQYILDSCEQKATLYINILAIPTKALRKAGSHVARVAKNGVKVYNRHKANSLVFNSKQKISLNCLLSSL
jgi:hypothetical protein